MSAVYIHYGSTEYDSSKFQPIKNKDILCKPEGGLWGSPVGCAYGWKEWCESSQFTECNESNSFKFGISDNANILRISSVSDLDGLPRFEKQFISFSSWIVLDFEKMLLDGVDAIELNISGDESEDALDCLYFKLYGWDCDSVLVMNKDVIIEC